MNRDSNIVEARKRIQKVKENRFYHLDLSRLGLKEIPEDISDLNYLMELDLSYNAFSSMPEMIAKMTNLKVLDLSYNEIMDINFLYGECYSFQELNISNNYLYHIPKSIDYLNSDIEIIFKNNPFLETIPNSIRSSSLINIQNYLELTKYKEKNEKLYETKLIFVGRGEVGKTTLMKVLIDRKLNVIQGKEEVTHGINISHMHRSIYFPAKKPHFDGDISDLEFVYSKENYDTLNVNNSWWDEDYEELVNRRKEYAPEYYSIDNELEYLSYEEKVELLSDIEFSKDSYFVEKDVKINMWDFGGQEIYYSTHQFFLTKRSIYVFVWEPRKDDNETDFEYWLNTIKLLGQNSPILVVMNKADIRHISIDEKTYENLFNIRGFFQVSCITKKGLDKLNTGIEETIAGLNHLGDIIPQKWMLIRNRLNYLQRDFINYTDFTSICKEYDSEISKSQIELLSEYLHDVGDIIHFKSDIVLKNIIIINPKWATKAVYSLIDSIPIQENNGVFHYNDLDIFLPTISYPFETHIQLLQLMEKFSICFKVVGGHDLYIIPELLKSEVPRGIDLSEYKKKDTLNFRIKFKFMPKGLMSRLICNLYYLLTSESYWKNGVVLNYESSKALIINNAIYKTLEINCIGFQKRDLLSIIRNELTKIFMEFNISESIDFHEEIPCICDYCQNQTIPYYFKNTILKNYIQKGKSNIECHESSNTVSIYNLLSVYRTTRPEERLIYQLLKAISRLQGLSQNIMNDEDSRNKYIATQLSQQGIVAKDQSKWGMSGAGKKQGELDIIVEDNEGSVISFFEGMNATYLDKNNINRHITKSINKYDANGLQEKYFGIYYTGKDFLNFTLKYFQYLKDFNHEGVEFVDVFDNSDQLVAYSEIKVFNVYYFKSGKKITLSHILINMQ
ncbi:COR domain-containing protein [Elizabethkingia anophelis]|uniref:COR domain-containing protein n=1 Tax=Elizabethkingia anophelis TaxID=1117645 RepID=UPI00160DBF81|nr:COR domain-containing protein [Elizabethkingia anophelis]